MMFYPSIFDRDRELPRMLAYIEEMMSQQKNANIGLDESYTSAYTGAIAGSTAYDASTYKICLWSYTDIIYLQGVSTITASRFTFASSAAGVKIVEAVALSGTTTSATGTITSVTGTAVTGIGTAFTTEAIVGGSILVDGQRRYITAIADNTHLTIAAALSGPYSGTDFKFFGASQGWTISSGSTVLLPTTYRIDSTDPDYFQTTLSLRSYLYDAALALIVMAKSGNTTLGNRIVDSIATSITNTDTGLGTTGACPFSNDVYDLAQGDLTVVRSGAAAWVGYALLIYYETTGYAAALTNATKIATYLLTLQVAAGTPNDFRAGLIRGGQTSAVQITWISVEHNVDCYYFFKRLYGVTGTASYATARSEIKAGLLNNCYDSTLTRFIQGTEATNKDYAEALDCYSWAGCFLLDAEESAKAVAVANRMVTKFLVTEKTIELENTMPQYFNQTYYCSKLIDGVRTYTTTTDGETGDSYVLPPSTAWQEGAQGVLMFFDRLKSENLHGSVTGFEVAYKRIEAGQATIYQVTDDGSFLSWTGSDRILPYEFQVWRSMTPSAWCWMRLQHPNTIFYR